MRSTTSHDALLKPRPNARRSQKVDWLALHSLGGSVIKQSDVGETISGGPGWITIGHQPGSMLSHSPEQFAEPVEDCDVDVVFEFDQTARAKQFDLEELDSFGPFSLPPVGMGLLPKTLTFKDFDLGANQASIPLRIDVVDASARNSLLGGQVVSATPPFVPAMFEPFTVSVVAPTTSYIDSSFSCVGLAQGTMRLASPMQLPTTTVGLSNLQRAHTRFLTHEALVRRPGLELNYFAGAPDLTARIAYRLARIPEMPRALDSVLPSSSLIDSALRVANYLPSRASLPQIEVDDSTGAISFVWRDEIGESVFSLEIPNPRSVIGVGVGPAFARYRPWRYSVTEERKIVGELQSSEAVKKLMLGGDELPR